MSDHSTALLLPNSEILIAGSSPARSPLYPSLYPSETRLEMYTPPYLFTGRPRPTVLQSSLTLGTLQNPIRYSSSLILSVTLPNRPPFGTSQPSKKHLEVVLIEPGYAGHGVVSGQRGLALDLASLEIAEEGSLRMVVRSPPGGGVAPPGWYLLFVVDAGVPSEGVWVQVGGVPEDMGEWGHFEL